MLVLPSESIAKFTWSDISNDNTKDLGWLSYGICDCYIWLVFLMILSFLLKSKIWHTHHTRVIAKKANELLSILIIKNRSECQTDVLFILNFSFFLVISCTTNKEWYLQKCSHLICEDFSYILSTEIHVEH